MEIQFENRDTVIYREYCHLTAHTQESIECVVPDTDADVEKIAAVQSSVFLKSKDLTPRGVLVSGEIAASVLYIGEGQELISCIRLKKPFSLEYEVDPPESETLAQIVLAVRGTDVRMINPRKLSVLFEIEGDLSCCRSEKLCVELRVPADTAGLHARLEDREITLPTAVCEKMLVVNEQFGFPAEKPLPAKLLSEQASIMVSDCQFVGTKAIVKGNASLTVAALCDGQGGPVLTEFTAPFSQIMDVGAEDISAYTVKPEITGAYFDLIDTISGGKALDMELHAVLQLSCSEQQKLHLVADAYSNLMPAELVCSNQEYVLSSSPQKKRIQVEERINLMENCAELLHVFASPSRVSRESDKLGISVNLDFVYRNGEDRLSSCRRTVTAAMETDGTEIHVLYLRPVQVTVKPEGEYADCGVMLEIAYTITEKTVIGSVEAVVLNDEQRYVQDALPTLTLVRPSGESLWSLAKKYHSSEEKIRQMNEDAENTGRILLIPKCI